MGLDMYLYKRSWIQSSEWVKPEFREEITMTRGGESVDTSRIKYVIEEMGYWRKANAIHRWFVEKVQGGTDDCGEYRVTREQLEELKADCEKALAEEHSREEVMPTQSGFFFGSTEYDDYYESDLKRTIEIVEDCLSDKEADDFYYWSSW